MLGYFQLKNLYKVKMPKICNQYFVKDTHRNKEFMGTAKCAKCNEESSLDVQFPLEMKLLSDFSKSFTKHHKIKGCNKYKSEPGEWASKSVSLGIA